jgi:succinoglycan biosynthesis protein ExoV
MKLFYFTRDDLVENFGDSLNPWLWEKFISSELDQNPVIAFVGIGTILNSLLPSRVPLARNFVIFSSGVGYGNGTIPTIDQHWKIYCVRGPLSAQKMGLSANLAVIDGAILIKRIFSTSEPKDCQFGFIPHVENAMINDTFWQEVCQQIGIRYIDPRQPIENVISLISKTEILLAEAMHGAIAAEALRVPWIPIRTNSRILTFKWVDWCKSINLAYKPAEIDCTASEHTLLKKPNKSGQNWLKYLEVEDYSSLDKLSKEQISIVTEQIIHITKTFCPNLAKDSLIESLTTQLEEKLAQFKKDVNSGKLDFEN